MKWPKKQSSPAAFRLASSADGLRHEQHNLALSLLLMSLLLVPASAEGLRVANPGINVPSNAPPTTFQLVPAFAGITLTRPTCLVTPPGDTCRLFVCEKESGKIKVIPDVAASSPTAHDFLSLSNIAIYDDQGILGLAFHPNYGTNSITQTAYCYVFYSWKNGTNSYSRLSRFTVTNPAAAAPEADPASEFILMEQLDRAGFHPGGDLHFGPDGYLYISLGDEGFYNDSLANAQRIDLNFYSAIARIDVDKRPGSLEPNLHPAVLRDGDLARYAVPLDNPFIGARRF
jgi:glucose/arabinose dehydrogenase